MPYTVQSTEKLRKSGADYETKALLYLMNFRPDSDEIHYFVIDFFNDLTGIDRYASKMWDLQSKGVKNNSPKTIGKELVTLYKNYISDFNFDFYILFMGGVTNTLRIDQSLSSFDISNVKSSAKKNIVEGLKEEATKKEYIDNVFITCERIDQFLNKVLFVIDDKDAKEYVREIVKGHTKIIPKETVLQTIFNEIRNKQSEKKNTCVEGITINTTDEVIDYCRHLTNSEIRLLALQRIINWQPLNKSIPISFIETYNKWPPEIQREKIDECQQTLCRALFNKSNAEAFWNLFETIYEMVVKSPDKDIQYIYNNINIDLKEANTDFDVISLKYYIAVIKDGIQSDN
jgi:hypothetical protein